MSLLDILFPKYCINCKAIGSYLCSDCFSLVAFMEEGYCVGCQKAAIDGVVHPKCHTQTMIDGVFSSLVYKGIVKRLIFQFKYKPYLTTLQGVLTEFFYEGLIQKEIFIRLLGSECVCIPIPLHVSKMRKRGYNQSLLLARGLGQKFSIQVVDCLERTRNTATQIGLSKKEREVNIRGAIVLKESLIKKITKYRHVILVDDVVTSGATLKEAAKVLKQAGVKHVWGATLAHGE